MTTSEVTTGNSIEKQIELKADVSRVWRAITNHEEFGAWFRVKLEGPFVVGQEARGKMLHPKYEHVTWRANVTAMKPESLFAFTWRPYALDPDIDYSNEEPTLVEFHLAPTNTGTLLTITESGFDRIPAYRRDEAFRMNDMGWSHQVVNIAKHVDENP